MRVLSSVFLYGNKVIPFEQPTLSANGTIGGDSFAVCSKPRYDRDFSTDSYKLFDGTSEKLTASDLLFGIYNPNPIRINNIDVYGSGFWNAYEQQSHTDISNNMEVYATNDYDEFMSVFDDYNFHEIEAVEYRNVEVLQKTFPKKEGSLTGTNVTADGVRTELLTRTGAHSTTKLKRYYKYYCIHFPLNQTAFTGTFYEIEINGAEKIKGV